MEIDEELNKIYIFSATTVSEVEMDINQPTTTSKACMLPFHYSTKS